MAARKPTTCLSYSHCDWTLIAYLMSAFAWQPSLQFTHIGKSTSPLSRGPRRSRVSHYKISTPYAKTVDIEVKIQHKSIESLKQPNSTTLSPTITIQWPTPPPPPPQRPPSRHAPRTSKQTSHNPSPPQPAPSNARDASGPVPTFSGTSGELAIGR